MILIFAIALFAVFGDRGLTDVLSIRGEREQLLKTNRGLKAKNKALERKIALLKTDKRYIGDIARAELGMIGRDEILYRFEDNQ